jgi:hypothetical protein
VRNAARNVWHHALLQLELMGSWNRDPTDRGSTAQSDAHSASFDSMHVTLNVVICSA